MTKKIKKSAKSSRPNQISKQRAAKYSAHHLAIILTSVLVLEGILFSFSTQSDWQKATALLDVSAGVSETTGDVAATFQPVVDLVDSIDQFYQLSATEMMRLLDLSDSGVGSEAALVYNGVSDFYQQSSLQMAQLLEVSNYLQTFQPIVAGASIVR
jgi:hypothetical protein